jgi:hypothetical protein
LDCTQTFGFLIFSDHPSKFIEQRLVLDELMLIVEEFLSFQPIVGIAEVPDLDQIESNARVPCPLAASMYDVLRERAILGEIGRADAISLITPEIVSTCVQACIAHSSYSTWHRTSDDHPIMDSTPECRQSLQERR